MQALIKTRSCRNKLTWSSSPMICVESRPSGISCGLRWLRPVDQTRKVGMSSDSEGQTSALLSCTQMFISLEAARKPSGLGKGSNIHQTILLAMQTGTSNQQEDPLQEELRTRTTSHDHHHDSSLRFLKYSQNPRTGLHRCYRRLSSNHNRLALAICATQSELF